MVTYVIVLLHPLLYISFVKHVGSRDVPIYDIFIIKCIADGFVGHVETSIFRILFAFHFCFILVGSYGVCRA